MRERPTILDSHDVGMNQKYTSQLEAKRSTSKEKQMIMQEKITQYTTQKYSRRPIEP